jgi:hypothetical protein
MVQFKRRTIFSIKSSQSLNIPSKHFPARKENMMWKLQNISKKLSLFKKTTFITKLSSLLWYLKNQRHLCSHHFNCFNSTVQLIYLGQEPIFYVPRPKYIIHIHASNINHYDVIDRALCILSHKVIKDNFYSWTMEAGHSCHHE